MIEIWNYISNIGLQPSYNEDLKKRIILQNRFNVLACIVYFVIGIVYFSFQDNKTAFFIESLILLNVVSFYAQKKYAHTFSLSLFLISGYLSIFYFDSYAGLDSGAFLYYPAVAISLLFLFDIKGDKKVIIGHFLAIILLILIHQYTDRNLFKSEIMTAVMKSRLFTANLILSSVSVCYFAYLAIKSEK